MSEPLSNEEKKFLINSIWDSLIEADWTPDKLIAFGKAIHSRKRLRQMEDSVFNQIFPSLKTVSENLQEKLSAWSLQRQKPTSEERSTQEKSPPAEEEKNERG